MSEELRIGFFTDLHVASQAPAARKDDYATSVLNKLEFCLKRCADCDFIVFGGDMTHSHKLGNDRLKERIIDVFNENLRQDQPFFYTYGQHELRGEDLGSKDESTTAFIMRMLTRLGHTVAELPHEGWFKYRGVAFSACPRGVEPRSYFESKKPDPKAMANVIVVHHLISDKTAPWLIDYNDLKTEGIDVVLSGDLHCGFEPAQNQSGTLFVNPGSLTRTAKAHGEIERKIRGADVALSHDGRNVRSSVSLWDVETALPASEVFREDAPFLDDELPEQETEKATTKSFDEVVARLSNVKVKKVDVWSLLEKRARETQLEPEVLSFLLSKRPMA